MSNRSKHCDGLQNVTDLQFTQTNKWFATGRESVYLASSSYPWVLMFPLDRLAFRSLVRPQRKQERFRSGTDR
ncbi:hypothetical protein VN12_22680 [Pirellula sp. SH-Sr6A]|nr:hypothetical protein VN12_22680 [Pirellula sp. SH-Sr6A]